jgi:DNA primase
MRDVVCALMKIARRCQQSRGALHLHYNDSIAAGRRPGHVFQKTSKRPPAFCPAGRAIRTVSRVIPQSFIQDLLNRVDIVDVVGKYVQLKKGGANFMGLCPFHNEKSPSFTVSPTKQFYHCFGCGAHGSAIGFLMEYSGQSYPDAVRELAQSVGLSVPEERNSLPPAQRAEQQARSLALTDAMTRATDFYKKQLRGAPQAIQYLKGRGLTGEIAAHFGLGYAPDDWQGLETVFGSYRDDAIAGPLVEAGLLIESQDKRDADGKPRRYDRFRDRIMFPIRNTKGNVIGFGGRVMGQGEPKYLNSPETPLFSKGTELYGLFEARHAIRENGYVLVVEGYMDVVALAQLGFANAVATLGTACTPVHVQKLMRQTDAVVFSFDGDAAGRRAARRALEACLPHVADNKTIRFLFLPAEHDPDSYVREEEPTRSRARFRTRCLCRASCCKSSRKIRICASPRAVPARSTRPSRCFRRCPPVACGCRSCANLPIPQAPRRPRSRRFAAWAAIPRGLVVSPSRARARGVRRRPGSSSA